MKKSKFFAIVASMFLCISASAVVASAASFDFAYNTEKTEALGDTTKRVIDVYAKDVETVAGVEFQVKFFNTDGTVAKGTVTASTMDFKGASPTANKFVANAAIHQLVWAADADGAIAAGDTPIGTITLTLSSDVELDATLVANKCKFSWYENGAQKSFVSPVETFKIGKYPVSAPVEPELPVFDDELTATPIDGLFDEHTDTVPVKAWMTDAIDWSSYKEVKDLKWVITVGDVANEVKATQAELSGDMTVIYALAIAGRADQLETIESVVLK